MEKGPRCPFFMWKSIKSDEKCCKFFTFLWREKPNWAAPEAVLGLPRKIVKKRAYLGNLPYRGIVL